MVLPQCDTENKVASFIPARLIVHPWRRRRRGSSWRSGDTENSLHSVLRCPRTFFFLCFLGRFSFCFSLVCAARRRTTPVSCLACSWLLVFVADWGQ